MKRKNVASVSIIGLLVTLSASAIHAQSFYPLQAGNRWVYRNTDSWPGGVTDTTSVAVVGDTLMPNGHRYFRFQGTEAAGSQFARADSNWIYYYNYQSQDMPFYKLNASVGEDWVVNLDRWFSVTYIGRDTITVFDRQTFVQGYYLDGLAAMYVYLSDKFGPFFIADLYDPPGIYVTERRLIGTIIADTVYGTVVSVRQPDEIPSGFTLNQNFPNPFNPSTAIEFSIPHPTAGTLKVFDVLGREVEMLYSGELQPGHHSVKWRPSAAASGLYFYRLQTPEFVETKGMLLVR